MLNTVVAEMALERRYAFSFALPARGLVSRALHTKPSPHFNDGVSAYRHSAHALACLIVQVIAAASIISMDNYQVTQADDIEIWGAEAEEDSTVFSPLSIGEKLYE